MESNKPTVQELLNAGFTHKKPGTLYILDLGWQFYLNPELNSFVLYNSDDVKTVSGNYPTKEELTAICKWFTGRTLDFTGPTTDQPEETDFQALVSMVEAQGKKQRELEDYVKDLEKKVNLLMVYEKNQTERSNIHSEQISELQQHNEKFGELLFQDIIDRLITVEATSKTNFNEIKGYIKFNQAVRTFVSDVHRICEAFIQEAE